MLPSLVCYEGIKCAVPRVIGASIGSGWEFNEEASEVSIHGVGEGPFDLIFAPLVAQELLDGLRALAGVEEGFDGVMLKPFRENDLLNRLNIAVDKPSAEISNGLADSLLDLSSLKVMTQGDDALLHTILVQFVVETVADLDKLAELFKSPEPAAVREVVHKLSGRTGQVGATSLSKALRGLEVRLVNGESPEKMEDDLRYAVAKVELLIEEVKQMAGPETAHLVK